jgi:hypothetical protein
MFAAILKNTILFFFITCIGYFIVDNHLNDLASEYTDADKNKKIRTVKSGFENTNTQKSSINESDILLKTTQQPVQPFLQNQFNDDNLKDIVSDNSENPMSITIDTDVQDIYDYVYSDVKAIDNLNAIYDKNIVKDIQNDLNIICESDNEENKKVITMCARPIQEHHEDISYINIETKSISDQSIYDFVDKHI